MSSTSSIHWVKKEAGRIGGLSKSARKIEALKTNAAKASAARMEQGKYLKASDCTCGCGATKNHRVSCQIYKKVAYRRWKNLEIVWL
jgi:hypothetical protein